ncbi:hypothetical protein A9Q96_13360 [Rhodobacterales bacterium 52_120_T64]|nr:hypothetical protein A9Q96_13360 [Rhodobacterales bacterium 52_120_T64]
MTKKRITIKPAVGTWVVRAGGAVIAESDSALEVHEGDYPVAIYFPREDVAMAFLDTSDQRSTCPYKGEASYFGIAAKSGVIENSVWTYEEPIEAAKEIAGYLSFYTDKATVERF